MNDSLKFLFTRLKKPTLTREETERKVCQEVFVTNIRHDQTSVKRMLEELLVRRNHFFKSFELAIAEACDALSNKHYSSMFQLSRRNWTGKDVDDVISAVITYLRAL